MRRRTNLIVELAAFVLLLFIFNPYRDQRISFTASSGRDVTVGMALYHGKPYPAYSQRFFRFLGEHRHTATTDKSILQKDLTTVAPAGDFSTNPGQPVNFLGSDPGMAWGLSYLWKISGEPTLQTMLWAFYALHLAAAFSLFFMARFAGIPGFALFAASVFTYSPVILRSIHWFAYYFFEPFAVIFATLGLLVLDHLLKSGNRALKTYLLSGSIGALLGFLGFFRSSVHFVLIPMFTLLVVSVAKHTRIRTGTAILISLGAAFLITKMVVGGLIWDEASVAANSRKSHPFWHSIWAGMGEFPNPHGFVAGDIEVFEFARNKNPNVVLQSDEYEQILRDHVIQVVRSDPGWILSLVVKRTGNFARQWLEFFPGVGDRFPIVSIILFLVATIGSLALLIELRDQLMIYILIPFYFFMIVPILIFSSYDLYAMPPFLALAMSLYYVVARTAMEMWKWRA